MNYDLLKGCLCWFWDRNEAKPRIGILVDYFGPENPYPFYEMDGGVYAHCKPASYKDITFYNENPMKQTYLSAKEKAKEGILGAIDTFLAEEKESYKNESPNANIAMEKDNIHRVCGESDEVCEAIRKYMELI
jgi:hypothetical protein